MNKSNKIILSISKFFYALLCLTSLGICCFQMIDPVRNLFTFSNDPLRYVTDIFSLHDQGSMFTYIFMYALGLIGAVVLLIHYKENKKAGIPMAVTLVFNSLLVFTVSYSYTEWYEVLQILTIVAMLGCGVYLVANTVKTRQLQK